MHSLFYQLSNCNLFTHHVISLWRDTSSELWILVHSFTLILPSTANTIYFSQALFYFTANKHLFLHYTSNPLFWAHRWNWQPHCKLGQNSFFFKIRGKVVWLCYVGSTLLLVQRLPRQPRTRLFSGALSKSASNNLQKWFLSPTSRLNFSFILRENLLLCLSYLLLGFPNWSFETSIPKFILLLVPKQGCSRENYIIMFMQTRVITKNEGII
jgi:hypothetical protein